MASWNFDPISVVISISLAPIPLLLSIPIDGNQERKRGTILRHCLSFASGSLLVDAFLLLIPYSMKIYSKEEQNDVGLPKNGRRQNPYFKIGLYTLIGITMWLIFDKLLKKGLKNGHSTIFVTIFLGFIQSKKKAVLCQMMTFSASVTGCLVVMHVKEAGDPATSCGILAFMAGGFIYNATVNILSELKENISKGTESLIETCLFLVGICVMKLLS